MRDFFVYLARDLWRMLQDWPYGTLVGVLIAVLVVALVLIVFAGLFLGVDYILGHDESRTGVVVEKAYNAASTGTGVGPSIGWSGGVAVVITSNPDKYILFVKLKNGKIDKVEVDKNTWISANKGDSHSYIVRVGRFTGE